MKHQFKDQSNLYGTNHQQLNVDFDLQSIPGLYGKLSKIVGVEKVGFGGHFDEKYKVTIEKAQLHSWDDVKKRIKAVLLSIDTTKAE